VDAECGMSSEGRVTSGKAASQIIQSVLVSSAPSEFGDDPHRDRIATNTSEVLTQQVCGPIVIASRRRADHFDVVTLPVHLALADRARGRFGEGVEAGHGERECRIHRDSITERHNGGGQVCGLLCLAIGSGGLHVCRDPPTVVLDRWTSGDCWPLAGIGLFWVAMHDTRLSSWPEVLLRSR
jgi:hypothetical protein